MKYEALLVLIVLILPIIAFYPYDSVEINSTKQPLKFKVSADTTITGSTVWQDTTVVLDGNLIIKNGSLFMKNVTLQFNGTYSIYVQENASLTIINCTLTVTNTSLYRFTIEKTGTNSTLYINDTKIENLGTATSGAGILIYTGNVTINNTVFTNSFGVLAESVKNVTIQNTNFTDARNYAIKVVNSAEINLISNYITKSTALSTEYRGVYVENSLNISIINNKVANVSISLNLTADQFDTLNFVGNQLYHDGVFKDILLYFNQSDISINNGDYGEIIIAYSENCSINATKAHFFIIGSKDIEITHSNITFAEYAIFAINVSNIIVYHNYVNFTTFCIKFYDVVNYSVYLNTFGAVSKYVEDDGAYTYDNGYFGNYWRNLNLLYGATDSDGDGVVDSTFVLDSQGDSIDRFPLMEPQYSQDTLPPKVFIVSPINNSYINTQTFDIVLDIHEEWSGVLFIEYDTGSGFQLASDSTFQVTLSEGTHLITIRVADKQGNVKQLILNITVDIHNPSLSLIQPSNNSYLTSAFLIKWDSSDNIDLDHHELIIDDYLIATLSPSDQQYNLEYVAEGTHEIIVKAVDKAGNVEERKVFVTVDVSPPVLSLISPANNSYFNTSDITINLGYYDKFSPMAILKYSINGSDWISTTKLTLNIKMSAEGKYFIRIRVYDSVGNYDEIVVVLTYDTTPPEISISTPQENDTFLEGAITIAWSASDESGIAYYELILGNETIKRFSASDTTYTITLKKGNYTITVVAYDNAGNVARKSVTFKVITIEDLQSSGKEIQQPTIPVWIYFMVGSAILLIGFAAAYKLFLGEFLSKRKAKGGAIEEEVLTSIEEVEKEEIEESMKEKTEIITQEETEINETKELEQEENPNASEELQAPAVELPEETAKQSGGETEEKVEEKLVEGEKPKTADEIEVPEDLFDEISKISSDDEDEFS